MREYEYGATTEHFYIVLLDYFEVNVVVSGH